MQSTQNPSLETLKSYPILQNLLENETAICTFFLDEMAVFRTDTGKFFYHPLPEAQREFFFRGQAEATKDLAPVPEQYAPALATLTERDRIAAHFDLRLVCIEHSDREATEFVVYSEDLQVFFLLSRKSFDAIGEDTAPALAALGTAVNTFADPIAIELDALGIPTQEVRQDG